jgi:hypothetical protein
MQTTKKITAQKKSPSKLWSMIGLGVYSFTLAASAQAGPRIISSTLKQKGFTVPAGTCGLKRFSLADYMSIEASGTIDGGYYLVHDVGAVIDVSDPSCNAEYAVVQFVKGCGYHLSRNNDTKALEYTFQSTRSLQGVDSPTIYKDWTVDSPYVSPMLANVTNDETFSPDGVSDYRVSRHPLRLDRSHLESSLAVAGPILATASDPATKDSVALSTVKSTATQIFVNTLSNGESYYPKQYKSGNSEMEVSSLQYMSCVYHTKDIPDAGSPQPYSTAESMGGPVTCIEWSDNTRFDSNQNHFVPVTDNQIDAFCTSPAADAELKEYKAKANESSLWNLPVETVTADEKAKMIAELNAPAPMLQISAPVSMDALVAPSASPIAMESPSPSPAATPADSDDNSTGEADQPTTIHKIFKAVGHWFGHHQRD